MAQECNTRLRVLSKNEVAERVVSLELAPAGDGVDLPEWKPGAHIDLACGDGVVRQYSLCGEQSHAGVWTVAVLREEESRGGSAWVHDMLQEGDEVTVKGPRNNFPLEDAPSYLFVAGGIGITPILPMIRAVEAEGRPWRLAYGGRTRGSMAFMDELAAYGDRVEVYPEDEAGLLDLPAILGEEKPGRRVYCCGPEPLLAAVEKELAPRTNEALHVERFAPRPDVFGGGEAFEVEVASSGKRVVVGEDESIIDALARIDVEVEFSCREGTCGTCETALLGGVPEHRDSVLEPEEQAANDCMMVCVGRCAQGPLILDL